MGSGFLAALASLAAPIAARVLLALGMAVVTVGGVAASIGGLKSAILSSIGGASENIVLLAGLAGCWEGLGLVFGAVTFAISFWTATQATKIIGVGT